MTGLRPALVAMVVWALHFFGAYGLMLALPDAPVVAWLTLGLGFAGLIALAVIIGRGPRNAVVVLATLVAGIGILFQSIVGLF